VNYEISSVDWPKEKSPLGFCITVSVQQLFITIEFDLANKKSLFGFCITVSVK
jgi:hypothetical protein